MTQADMPTQSPPVSPRHERPPDDASVLVARRVFPHHAAVNRSNSPRGKMGIRSRP